jgi:hypothetical protein
LRFSWALVSFSGLGGGGLGAVTSRAPERTEGLAAEAVAGDVIGCGGGAVEGQKTPGEGRVGRSRGGRRSRTASHGPAAETANPRRTQPPTNQIAKRALGRLAACATAFGTRSVGDISRNQQSSGTSVQTSPFWSRVVVGGPETCVQRSFWNEAIKAPDHDQPTSPTHKTVTTTQRRNAPRVRSTRIFTRPCEPSRRQ